MVENANTALMFCALINIYTINLLLKKLVYRSQFNEMRKQLRSKALKLWSTFMIQMNLKLNISSFFKCVLKFKENGFALNRSKDLGPIHLLLYSVIRTHLLRYCLAKTKTFSTWIAPMFGILLPRLV